MGEQISDYPYIDKIIVRENFKKFIRKKFAIKNTGFTSGTTGSPAIYYRDIRSMAAEQYFQSSYFGWKRKYMIYFRGQKLFKAGVQPQKIYKIVPFIKEMYISSYNINDDTLKNVVKILKKKKNKCLWAYPTSAYLLAEYCLRNKEKIDFDIVALSSETLDDYQVETMEKAFNCKVKDLYGQSERVAALYRCSSGNYHEVANYSFVEYLKDNSGKYNIIGTTLHNRIMPLVRFDMKDLVDISEIRCPCGNHGENISKIHGRMSSYIELPSGKIPQSALTFILKDVDNILETQIIQRKSGNIEIKVVRLPEYSKEDEINFYKCIGKILPVEAVTLIYTERIERDKGGKFRYVINENI
jgi:phenylacetate-CoA ligase